VRWGMRPAWHRPCRWRAASQRPSRVREAPRSSAPTGVAPRLHGCEPLRPSAHVGRMDGSHRGGCDDRAMMVWDRDPLLPCLRRGPRLSHVIARCVATVWVPSPWSPLVSRGFAAARWGHTGEACLPPRPSSRPCHEDGGDGRVMDGGVATGLGWDGHALPWPPHREAPHDAVQDVRRAPWPVRPRWGIARGGKRPTANAGAAILFRQGPHTGHMDACERINVLQR
jgi:hypothetical protein